MVLIVSNLSKILEEKDLKLRLAMEVTGLMVTLYLYVAEYLLDKQSCYDIHPFLY